MSAARIRTDKCFKCLNEFMEQTARLWDDMVNVSKLSLKRRDNWQSKDAETLETKRYAVG